MRYSSGESSGSGWSVTERSSGPWDRKYWLDFYSELTPGSWRRGAVHLNEFLNLDGFHHGNLNKGTAERVKKIVAKLRAPGFLVFDEQQIIVSLQAFNLAEQWTEVQSGRNRPEHLLNLGYPVWNT